MEQIKRRYTILSQCSFLFVRFGRVHLGYRILPKFAEWKVFYFLEIESSNGTADLNIYQQQANKWHNFIIYGTTRGQIFS